MWLAARVIWITLGIFAGLGAAFVGGRWVERQAIYGRWRRRA